MLNRNVPLKRCIFRDDVSNETFLYSLGISNVTAAEAQTPDEELTLMSAFTDGGRTAAQRASGREILERT
jgi:hypothetical protein